MPIVVRTMARIASDIATGIQASGRLIIWLTSSLLARAIRSVGGHHKSARCLPAEPTIDPLHAIHGMPWRTPLFRAFAAGQGQSATASGRRWQLRQPFGSEGVEGEGTPRPTASTSAASLRQAQDLWAGPQRCWLVMVLATGRRTSHRGG
jgi:hypothetical protein